MIPRIGAAILLLATAMTLSACYVAPPPGPGPGRCPGWVPGHYGAYGVWHPGHCA